MANSKAVKRTPEEYAALDVLKKQLFRFRELDPYISVASILCFLEIAQDEGLSLRDLERLIGELPQAVLSRYVALLAQGPAKGDKGFNLVDASYSEEERRRKLLTLTPKGTRFMNALVLLAQQNKGEVQDADSSTKGPVAG